MIAVFNELIQQSSYKKRDWLMILFWKIQNWRIHQVHARIESINQQIKKHVELTIDPLVAELSEMEEEQRIRAALGMKQP